MMVAGYSGRLLYAGMSCDGLKQVSNLTDTPTLAICQSPEKYLDENKHRFMFFVFVLESGQTITNCVSVKKVANKKDYEKVLKPCDNILPLICEGR